MDICKESETVAHEDSDKYKYWQPKYNVQKHGRTIRLVATPGTPNNFCWNLEKGPFWQVKLPASTILSATTTPTATLLDS